VTPPPRHLRRRVRESVLWAFLEHGYTWALTFGSRIVLARLLSPRDFGLVAIVTLVQDLVVLFGMRGIAASLIQRREQVEAYATAAFWLNILVGAAIGVVQIALAPVAARVFGEPQLAVLLPVAAIAFFITPWGVTHNTLLAKELKIKRRALRHAALRTVATAGMIVMAVRGYGVWSFVIPPLLVDPLEVLLNWRLHPWRPRLRLDLQHWREIAGYGKHVLGADVLRYLMDNTDYWTVGRVLGTAALGVYAFAFRQAMFAVDHVTRVAARVTFPTFALLQRDEATVRQAFTKALLLITSVTLPLQLGQLALTREYIVTVYSAKWLPAVDPFRILLLYGTALAVAALPRSLLAATGRPHLVWRFHALVYPVLLAAIALGVRAGPTGVATAVGLVLGGSAWVFIVYALRLLRWPLGVVLGPLRAPVTAGLVMFAAVSAARWALVVAGVRPAGVLGVCVPLGAAVYGLTLGLAFPGVWRELRGFVRRAGGDFARALGQTVRRARARLPLTEGA